MAQLLTFTIVMAAGYQSASGQTWRLLLPYSSYNVQINRLDPQKLYVGYKSNQMFRSYTGGTSWELIEISTPGPSSAITSLVVSSQDTGTIFAGGFLFNGIKRSQDGGQLWKLVERDSNPIRQWFISDAIIEDPNSPSIMFAARGSGYNTIYKSTDAGASWDSISAVSSAITTRLCTITARYDSSNILFTGCLGGVIARSDDGGYTWRRVPVLNGKESISSDAEIPKIVFSKNNPMRGYAVVSITSEENIRDNGGLLGTSDGGLTWDRIAFPDTGFWAVEVLKTPSGIDEILIGGFRLSVRQNVIKGDSLVYQSTDGGLSWSRFENIPWDPTPDGDTTRNIWMLRRDTVGDKTYMATEMGLYVLDDLPLSVDEDDTPTLTLKVNGNVLLIDDLNPDERDSRWGLYSMNAVQVASGVITHHERQAIDISTVCSGVYLLLWGSDRNFRTATIQIIR